MNLLLLKDKLLELGKSIGLRVDEETKDSLSLHSEITAENYFNNSIYFRVVIFTSGTLHIFFTFDEMEKTYDNLFLINNFNAESPWFKAYIANINDKDFLELHYVAINLVNENEVAESIEFMLNSLISEETLNLLNPILNND